jgi:hypothetical protein
MNIPSIVPNDRLDKGFYLVLEDFRAGPAFRETDEGITYVKLIDDLLTGQYDKVIRVVAFNPVEGWSRDASEDIANALEAHIAAESREVSEAMEDFIEGQTGTQDWAAVGPIPMSPIINLPMLVLAAVRVASADGRPMTARDVAFLLAVPQEGVDLALDDLVVTGSITQDGDLYRHDVTRQLTAAESGNAGVGAASRGAEVDVGSCPGPFAQLNDSHSAASHIDALHIEIRVLQARQRKDGPDGRRLDPRN